MGSLVLAVLVCTRVVYLTSKCDGVCEYIYIQFLRETNVYSFLVILLLFVFYFNSPAIVRIKIIQGSIQTNLH